MMEPIIEVIDCLENEDGSADVIVRLNEEGKELLIQEGLVSIISKYIKKVMEDNEVEKNACCGTCCSNVSNNN